MHDLCEKTAGTDVLLVPACVVYYFVPSSLLTASFRLPFPFFALPFA